MNAESIIKLLEARGWTVSCAESFTGGLVADALVSVPGASAVFAGGVVAYSDDIKRSVLSVPGELLSRCTAVSGECAAMMALGAENLFKTDFAVATTGYAGPDGEDVGLCYIACAKGAHVRVYQYHLSGGRAHVRKAGTLLALKLLYEQIRQEEE